MPISVRSPRSLTRCAVALRAIVRETLLQEGRRPGELAIVLSDDAELRVLNRQWRGIDRATDVLSFAYDEDAAHDPRAPVDGDLVISMDRVAEQAKRFRVTPGDELARLAIHGALHLAGLDHQRATQRMHMRTREDAAMRRTRAARVALGRALRDVTPRRSAR